MSDLILNAKALTKQFVLKRGAVLNAVNHIDLQVRENETLAIVGESGSGKTTLSRLLLLLDKPTSGILNYQGKNVDEFDRAALKDYRRNVQAVFQNPYSSLNPRLRVKQFISEPLIVQGELKKSEIRERVEWALTKTGLRLDDGDKFPHQFSGGQRQRVAIARAIASMPKLIILDEPVSSQDISIQAQILNLLKDLQKEMGMSYLFIAHDLATVRYMSDRVSVMYLGKFVESGDCEDIFNHPLHPYTKALFASALPDHPSQASNTIPLLGEIPSPLNPPSGCTFHPRCPISKQDCKNQIPSLKELGPSHWASCFYTGQESIEEIAHEQ